MNKAPKLSDDLATALVTPSQGVGILISTGVKSLKSASEKKLESIPEIINSNHQLNWNIWGDDDQYPNRTRKFREENPDLSAGLAHVTMSIVSDGLLYGTRENINGKWKYTAKNGTIPAVDEFWENSSIDKWFSDGVFQFMNNWKVFSESIIDDSDKISLLRYFPSGYYRVGKQDKYGLIPNCYFNPNFMDGYNIEGIELPLLDKYGNKKENIKALKSKRFVEACTGFGDAAFYPPAPWHSLITSNVLAFSKLIWNYKTSMLNNALNVMLHIEIADFYWTDIYGKDFFEWTYEKKVEAMQKELDNFNAKLKGSLNAGNSLLTTMKLAEDGKTLHPSWRITPIDRGNKDNLYLEDSREVTSIILRTIFQDSTLSGAGMGKGGGIGSGSGSDKKAAASRQSMILQYIVNTVCEPLYSVKAYNGWDKNLVFWTDTQVIQDQSSITPSERNNPNPPA